MNAYLISGASRGLGAALMEALDVENNKVWSISRSSGDRAGLRLKCDLSDPRQTSKVIDSIFAELDFSSLESLALINNAGVLGPVGGADKLESSEIVANLSVNLVSPILLSSLFQKAAKSFKGRKLVVNITSGAAVNAYDGWSLYCASKSGLEHYARCAALEQKKEEYPATIINVNPGPMDTSMQEAVRSADESDFSSLRRFIDLKENDLLSDPAMVARLLAKAMRSKELISGKTYKILEFENV